MLTGYEGIGRVVVSLQGARCPGGSRGRLIKYVPHLDREVWSKASISGNRSSDPSFLEVREKRDLILPELDSNRDEC